MLISPEYRELQRQFHAQRSDYGVVGHTYAEDVLALADATGARSILDYGAGKGTLQAAILQSGSTILVHNYDPCIDMWATRPANTFDIVACTDVLEHVEIDYLESIIRDIMDYAEKAVFLAIHTGPAKKTLPDGRNAHLIQHDPRWWINQIAAEMSIHNILFQGTDLRLVGQPK